VADEKLRGPAAQDDRGPGMYVTTEQSPQPYQGMVVRTVTDTRPVERAIPYAVRDVDANQVVQDMETLEDIKAELVGAQRLHSLLLGIFSGVALLLSAIGLYGVISYSMVQRTREIGIRTALGATADQNTWLILRSGLALSAVGLAAGYAGSLGAAQLLSSLLFGVGKHDTVTLGSVVITLASVAALASYIPARRAARVDAIVALRYE